MREHRPSLSTATTAVGVCSFDTTQAATGVANDEVFIDGIQLGFLGGLGLSSTGTVFMDDFESRAQSDFPTVP